MRDVVVPDCDRERLRLSILFDVDGVGTDVDYRSERLPLIAVVIPDGRHPGRPLRFKRRAEHQGVVLGRQHVHRHQAVDIGHGGEIRVGIDPLDVQV